MNDIINIQMSDNGQRAVDARELHSFLEVKSKFATWVTNRINEYGFVENQDYMTISINLENGGRSKEYSIFLDMAKELAMVECNAQGRKARQYFIEIEKQYRMGFQSIANHVCIQELRVRIEAVKRGLSVAMHGMELLTTNVNRLVLALQPGTNADTPTGSPDLYKHTDTVYDYDGKPFEDERMRSNDSKISDMSNRPFDTVELRGKMIRRIKWHGRYYYCLLDIMNAVRVKTHTGQKASVLERHGQFARKFVIVGSPFPAWFTNKGGVEFILTSTSKLREQNIVFKG